MIQKADLDGIWENFNVVVAEGVYLPVYTPVISDWEKKTWYNDLFETGNFCVIAQDLEGVQKNLVAGQVTIENLNWEAADHVGLLGIIVNKDFRNLGLGWALIEYTKKIALRRGKSKLNLSTLATNTRGIHLYQKCGFNAIGFYSKQYLIQEEYVDELLMECFLEEV
ncbi:hypothetical protein NEF87_003942 [Candidatus Lokiarchaeum ossiferum]|uniref:N-acetyltransferase domain-containing protein n=1 Tax=Candidatus Lokiarchaeum ossiferum TaxID=2951803 RepID=A0ABY6HVW1_9ARCH|nr:hypothetical protein NEF87_003942 [Candidatus Lokiarchaeum sp. B-35]